MSKAGQNPGSGPDGLRRYGRPLKRVFSGAERKLYTLGLLSVDRLSLPDFLGLGAPQSGSTWLHANLRHHPELFLPAKELHYFDCGFHKSIRFYAAKFAPGRGKVKGEITPGYSILPGGRIRFIRRVMPDVRLIYILRNPIERAWSVARRRFGKRVGPDLSGVDQDELIAYLRTQPGKPGAYGTNLMRGDYLRNLDNWLSVFPQEQLLVGFFQDIMERPRELLTQVFSHLGVSPDLDWGSLPYQKVINKNPELHMPPRCREVLVETYTQDIEELYRRFGEPVASWRCA